MYRFSDQFDSSSFKGPFTPSDYVTIVVAKFTLVNVPLTVVFSLDVNRSLLILTQCSSVGMWYHALERDVTSIGVVPVTGTLAFLSPVYFRPGVALFVGLSIVVKTGICNMDGEKNDVTGLFMKMPFVALQSRFFLR